MTDRTVSELLRAVDPSVGLILPIADQQCLVGFHARPGGVRLDISTLDGADRTVLVDAEPDQTLGAVLAVVLERHGQPGQWPVWGSHEQADQLAGLG